MDYVALKNEFTIDPEGYGYAAPWAEGSVWKLANLINEIHPDIPIERTIVDTYEVFQCIVPAEWAALDATEKERIQLVLSLGKVNIKDSNTRASLTTAFTGGTTTRTNLIALQTRPGSRAEQLFGTTVTWEDINAAYQV